MSDGVIEQTVFIADDDEDLNQIDEWVDDAGAQNDGRLHAPTIQLQVQLCFVLLCALLVLAALIALAWRAYGGLISKASAGQLVDRSQKHYDEAARRRRSYSGDGGGAMSSGSSGEKKDS